MTSPDQPRTVLRHYEIMGEIGRGGMGVVYEGRDRRDGSKVAIKALHPYLAAMDQGFRERFEREAHIAALLRSPYTVHLLDFGIDAGQYLLVMEFIEGESLASILERGPVETLTALQFAAETARALEEASARGVVHRDIKPDNILVETDGRVKVTDFGIARQSGGGGMTQVGAFVGTAAYAAPEQVEGEADSRSDIYSLGATLYCMLAGEPPYRGRTAMDVLVQHRTISLPMAPLAGLPDIVQNIVRRCLEKDPRDRYTTPSELASALERARTAITRMPTQPTIVPEPPAGYVRPQPQVIARAEPRAPADHTVVAAPTPGAAQIVAPQPATVVQAPSPASTVIAAASQPAATLIQAPTPSADQTVVAPAASAAPPLPVPPAAPPYAGLEPAPQSAPAGKRRRPNFLLAALGLIVTAGAGIGIFFVLNSGGDSPKSGATASPTAPVVVDTTATATGPTAAPTPVPPTVFPPVAAQFSILAAGVQARVVDSLPGADGQCPAAIWNQPSETASATNKAVVRLCTNDVVTVGADPPKVAEGATWWHVTANGGAISGWAKEGTVDGSHRTLALNNLQFKAPDNVIDAKSAYRATIMTSMGNITIDLLADQSPHTVNAFVFLAEKGFYSGTTFFHLVKSSFIEGGDPTGTGSGDAGYQLAVEGNTVRNVRGAIAMSAVVGQFGSKFFIYTADNPILDFDGTQLAKVFPFGNVTKGLDVLDQIAATKTAGLNIAVTPVTISNVVIEQRPK